MSSSEWASMKEIVRELATVFDEAQETETVAQIKDTESELRAVLSAREREMQENVRDLSARRDARKAEVMTLEQAHEYADQLAELQGMRDSILNSINKMKDESRVTAESVARLKQQVTDIKARMKDMTNAHDVPSIKLFLNIYSNITHLKWDYDAETVKGNIIPPHGLPACPFDIDPATASEMDVADQLWDMIDAAHTPSVARYAMA